MTNKEYIDAQISLLDLNKFVIDRQSEAMGDYWVKFKNIDDDDTDAINFAKLLIDCDVTTVRATKPGVILVRFF